MHTFHGRDHMVVGLMQSAPITTNVESSNPTQAIQRYVIYLSVTYDRSVGFPGYSRFLHQ